MDWNGCYWTHCENKRSCLIFWKFHPISRIGVPSRKSSKQGEFQRTSLVGSSKDIVWGTSCGYYLHTLWNGILLGKLGCIDKHTHTMHHQWLRVFKPLLGEYKEFWEEWRDLWRMFDPFSWRIVVCKMTLYQLSSWWLLPSRGRQLHRFLYQVLLDYYWVT